jgi:hypothetical protein
MAAGLLQQFQELLPVALRSKINRRSFLRAATIVALLTQPSCVGRPERLPHVSG